MIYLVSKQSIIPNEEITQEESLEHCIEYFQEKESIAVDTETQSLLPFDGKLLTVQLGDPENQWVIDVLTVDFLPLKELLLSKLLLFQNFKFDHKWFHHHGIEIKSIKDTYLHELILTTGYGHEDRQLGLGALALKYCNVQLNKEDRGLIHKQGLSLQVIRYCANDVKYLHEIVAKQEELLKKEDLMAIANLENKVARVFSLMEYNGMLIDRDKWTNIAQQAETNVLEFEKRLDQLVLSNPKLSKFVPQGEQLNLFGYEERHLQINWKSSQQKLQILQALGFNIASTDDEILRKIRDKHPMVKEILQYSKNQKIATTYGKSFLKNINKNTGKVHSSYHQILNNGRPSSSNPNLLNIPRSGELGKQIRSAFVARPGYKYVGGDYSGMELRILAELSQDPLWLDVFRRDGDLHSELCAATFGIPLSDVKKPFPPNPDITYRDCQKTVDFATAYGSSEYRLSDVLSISTKEAKEIITKFFKAVPKVKEFLDMLGKTGVAFGRIRTPKPFRRVRYFPNHKKLLMNPDSGENFKIIGEIDRACRNTPISGCNADITKQALVNLQQLIEERNLDAEIRLEVYDEIQCEVKEEIAEEFKVLLENTMIEAAQLVIKSIPVRVDVKIADYWAK